MWKKTNRDEIGRFTSKRSWQTIYILTNLVMFFITVSTVNIATVWAEAIKPIEVKVIEKVETIEYAYRQVTKYNAGDPYQTDNTPCIGASGDNICTLIAQGKSVCAANFVPFHTILSINGYGECEVLDRMNSRYPQNVDIAMPADKKAEAIKWGAPMMKVTIK